MSSVKELLRVCNKATKEQGEFCLFWWSFFPNPEKIHNLVKIESRKKEFSTDVFNDFIKICDNRLDMSKSLLNDLSIIFSAIFVAFAALATILTVNSGNSGAKSMDLLSMIFSPPVLTVFVIVLLIFIPVLLIWIGHLRTQIYTWASFKELAFIVQSEL